MKLDTRTFAVATTNSRSSPMSPGRMVELYFQPSRYFSRPHGLDHPKALAIAASIVGIAGAINQIDKKIIEAELGYATRVSDDMTSALLTSWPMYWLAVVIAGLIGAVVIWYLGGWWYKKRLQWSGALDPSPLLARRVFTMQELVRAGPTIVLTLIQTALFENYRNAWRADEYWTPLILIFVFWSCWTSYVGATTAFTVSKIKARIWFLVLPVLLEVLSLGLIGSLYAVLSARTV